MTTLHIIIDGYNLIRQSPTLSRIDSRDLQKGREVLLNRLAAYRRVRPHTVTVVFDGADAPAYYQHRDRVGGIDVRFSAPGQTADAVVRDLALAKREKALVVTSDREIVTAVEAAGAAAVSSREFEEHVNQALMMEAREGAGEEDADVSWSGTTKKKGPGRRLSKKERRTRTRVGKL
ncbi:MAG: NYN domain-containing protein [Thermodesulfobacteriota bacterium]